MSDSPSEDDPIANLTEWRTLGDLMDAGELPCGVERGGVVFRSIAIRPWSFADEGWLGEVQEDAPGRIGGFLRDAIGWLTSELAGVPMTRGDGEIVNPSAPCAERGSRALAVSSLCWGDLLTVLIMIKAADEPVLTLPGMVPGAKRPEMVRFDARTARVRCLATGRKPSDLQFAHAGATWGPATSRLLDLVPSGQVRSIKARHRILETSHVSGTPLAQMSRADLLAAPDLIERHTPGPKLLVPGKTDDGKEAVASIPLDMLFRF